MRDSYLYADDHFSERLNNVFEDKFNGNESDSSGSVKSKTNSGHSHKHYHAHQGGK